MINSGREKFFDGTLSIICNTSEVNQIYSYINSSFDGNLNEYLKSLNLNEITGDYIDKSFTTTGSVKFSDQEISTLIDTQIDYINNDYKDSLWMTLAGAWTLNNLNNTEFANVCINSSTGKQNDEETNLKNQEKLSAVISEERSLSFSQGMGIINSGRFSVQLSFENYIGEEWIPLKFTTTINTNTSGDVFGLLIFSNPSTNDTKQELNIKDGKALLKIIEAFSFLDSANNPVVQNKETEAIAEQYYNNFYEIFVKTMDTFENSKLNESKKQDKTQQYNKLSNAKPTNELTPSDNSIVVLPEVNLNGIVLNTFAQPDFQQPLSILDIIRNERNTSIQENFITLVQNNNLTSTETVNPASTEGCLNLALSKLSARDKTLVLNALIALRSVKNFEFENLTIQKNKLLNSTETQIGKIISGAKSAVGEKIKEVSSEVNDKATQTGNILKATWKDISALPKKFFTALKIPKPQPINLSDLAKQKFNETKTLLTEQLKKQLEICPEWNNLLGLVQKQDTTTITEEIKTLSKDNMEKLNQIISDSSNKQNELQRIEGAISTIRLSL